ncbi:MAG: class I SAM-dependent methyltransferase [Agathobacter sp.]|nr:class I SAM-dependent methyltransferase [Agathobacter sp.]
MRMTEKDWDKQLNIDTIGRDASKEDDYHYPYEPTPYSVLERLVESGYITKENAVIDYGCGKGRVGCFLHTQIGCRVIGIDFDERMCNIAKKNLQNVNLQSDKHNDKVTFISESAEKYEIKDADTFYFFNPFSVEILQSVIGKIKKSYFENPRDMQLFFYYPSDEYISYLMTVPELCFVDEIECQDLFEGDNPRERIVIFEMM